MWSFLHFKFLETGFTVGEIAGLISGSIATLHVIVPMTFAVIIVGITRNRQHDAATWSVIAFQLQSTLWPSLLQADASISNWMLWKRKKIPWRLFFLGLLSLIATMSLIAAGFLTPRPLVETKRPSHDITNASFQYVPDYSFYGKGTLPRPDNPIWRSCGAKLYMDCPQSTYDNAAIRGQYLKNPKSTIVVNTTIPNTIADIFTSGTKGTSIANPLDIQYRNWQLGGDIYVDNGELKAYPAFHPLQTFVLVNELSLIEGLVVDAVDGGVCFRNHTIPIGLTLGGQWSEDLLCFDPETACTNTNLTLGFQISKDTFTTAVNGYMRDDGGFSEISAVPPEPRWDDPAGWRDVGPVPDLQDRADKAAWWNNQFAAMALNVTESVIGQVYDHNFTGYVMISAPSSLKIDEMNGDYLDAVSFHKNSETSLLMNEYGARCKGFDYPDNATSDKAFIKCGYVYSVPAPTDEDNLSMYRYDLRSNWTQQLYTCASAVKASVKTVTFRTTGLNTLADTKVVSIQPKNYTDTNMPYWAVEKVDGFRYMVEDLELFWGLIDPSYSDDPNIVVRQGPSMYLPASTKGTTVGHVPDSFAAGAVGQAAWESVYRDTAIVSGSSEDYIPSYSGNEDYGLNMKWRELSKTTEGCAKILNLIWTDIVAFAVVGTRTGFQDDSSTLTKRDGNDGTTFGSLNVHQNIRIIEYDDIRYAIPAFIAATIFLFGIIGAVVMCCGCIVTRRTMIHYLNQTSMGRAVTQATDKDGISSAWTTGEWVENAGMILLDIPPPRNKVPKKHRRASNMSQSSAYSRGWGNVGNGGSGGGGGDGDYEMSPQAAMARRRVGGNEYHAVAMPPPQRPPLQQQESFQMQSPYEAQRRWMRDDFGSP